MTTLSWQHQQTGIMYTSSSITEAIFNKFKHSSLIQKMEKGHFFLMTTKNSLCQKTRPIGLISLIVMYTCTNTTAKKGNFNIILAINFPKHNQILPPLVQTTTSWPSQEAKTLTFKAKFLATL